MKLIDLLVKELPKRGGWPVSAISIAQDSEGHAWGYNCEHLTLQPHGWWRSKSGDAICTDGIKLYQMASDWNSTFVTRAQYESALAASEGWIEWDGGECPVDGNAMIDIQYRDGTYTEGEEARYSCWIYTNESDDIIAYRLHKPYLNSRANDDRLEQDLNECIGASEAQVHEWNGIGRPQVDSICQAFISGEWADVKIAYVGDEAGWNEALVFDVKSTKPAWADEFRPLRTEADKKRDEAIEFIREIIDAKAGDPFNSARFIYECMMGGNIPGVKLESK